MAYSRKGHMFDEISFTWMQLFAQQIQTSNVVPMNLTMNRHDHDIQ